MVRLFSRREVLKTLVSASAAYALPQQNEFGHAQTLSKPNEQPLGLQVTAISEHTLRVSLGDETPRLTLENDSLVQTSWPGSRKEFKTLATVKDTAVGKFSIGFVPDPLTLKVQHSGRDIQLIQIDPRLRTLAFNLGPSPVLAFGEGGPQFDRRGNVDQMRSGQGGYRLRTHGGRVPIQWLIGTNGWAIFIHLPEGTFDLTKANGLFTPKPNAGQSLDFFLVASPEPLTIMSEYAKLTGFPEMPPLWSLGYLQSHRTLRGPDEIKWVARTFRDKKLPCDALIYLGTDFTPSGWNTHNGEFTWKPETFPDPKKTIDELHGLHYKVVLHTVIEGRHLTGTVKDSCAVPEPSGRTPDGQWSPERSVGCYWPHHKGVYDLGIDGWWPDQGDGLDGPSRLNRIRMYWEGSQAGVRASGLTRCIGMATRGWRATA